MKANDNSLIWYIFTSLSGIAGIVNLNRAFSKSKDVEALEEIIKKQSELISLKDETIKSLSETLTAYKNEK